MRPRTIVILLLVAVAIQIATTYYLFRVNLLSFPHVATGVVAKEPFVVKINYVAVENPELLATAWRMIETFNWSSSNIAVIKVIVVLENRGNELAYYSFGGKCFPQEGRAFQPFTDHDGHRENIVFEVEEGRVFDFFKICQPALIQQGLLPGEQHVYEYYYVVSKPFRGTVSVREKVCFGWLSNFEKCETIESRVRIDIS